ncbi:MAG: hypothetical protein QOK21_4342 [Solirubrobacteraceae bacterium]|jgi:hypothetical protein|nr:hypothetical protein [Solirubrobacteraceae bacterium]
MSVDVTEQLLQHHVASARSAGPFQLGLKAGALADTTSVIGPRHDLAKVRLRMCDQSRAGRPHAYCRRASGTVLDGVGPKHRDPLLSSPDESSLSALQE